MTRVVDVSNSASFEDVAVMKSFEASTRNLLAQEAATGVRHHVALSVVGTERLSECGKYHGDGKPDGGRMTNEGVKAFFPEREQRAAPRISAIKSVSEQTGRSMAQSHSPGCAIKRRQ
jgi:hypothetical protein